MLFRSKEELFVFKEEIQLYNFLTKLSKSNKISSELNYNKIQSDHINEFNSLIEKFFDNVLVNDDNIKIKNNRMKLLHQRATNLLSSLNDWTFDYIPREKNTIADKYADLGRRKSN